MEAESKGINREATQRRAAGGATKTWLVVWQSGTSRLEEAGKHSVMRRTGISARDMRILDPALSYPSTVVGRERAVVVNLENIKAIVTATEMMILNPRDPVVAPFVRDLENKLSNVHTSSCTTGIEENEKERETSSFHVGLSKAGSSSSKELPFEFKALEICLEYACRCLESEASTLEQEAYPALDELCVSVNTLNLQRVRVIKSRLVALSARIQKVRDELEQLLDDDMDMAEMYLTRKLVSRHVEESEPTDHQLEDESVIQDDDDRDGDGRSNKSSAANPSGQKPNIQELEMLLDAYFVQLEGALNKLSTLREYVDDTEDFINIILDEKQNQLLQIGVVISTAIIILNFGIVIAGILGMNIRIPIFDNGVPNQFYATCGGVVAGILILYLIAIIAIKRKGLLG